MFSPELLSASRIALVDCLGLHPDERVAVITDEPCRIIGQAIFHVAREIAKEAFLIEITPRRTHGEEPPREVAELMMTMDVVLCPTSKSMTHTTAKRNAQAKGVRVATLPGVTEDMMVRCMNADYEKIGELTNKLGDLLEKTKKVRITSPLGTDLVMPIEGRKAIRSHGLFRHKGQGGNLPTGEAFVAPLEEQSNGLVVIDGSMAGIGILVEPLHIMVRNGYAREITGGADAKRLIDLLAIHGPLSRNLAEFGIGTNERAKITGVILEDEKVLGTVHVAFGDNVTMGGSVKVESHLDGLITSPSVWFDDRMIMKDGKLLV
ncbi:MAG: aminopeptidase [Ignavibacterium sp.]|jgi:leucyl aminopeptidase (aminopeptidase T)